MAGGGHEIRDSEQRSSRPSPSQGHPAQPWAPGLGVTVTLSQEQLPASPHTAQGHLGLHLPYHGSKAEGEKPKAEKGRDRVLCGVPRVGSRAECACLAMPDAHQCSLACFIITFYFSGWVGSSQAQLSRNEAAWEAGCVSLSEWASWRSCLAEEPEPEGSWKFQTSSSPFLGSRHVPYPAAVEEAEPDVPAEDSHARPRGRDHLAAA